MLEINEREKPGDAAPTLHVEKSWVTGRIALEYTYNGCGTVIELSAFVDRFCRSGLFPTTDGDTLVNLKGVDRLVPGRDVIPPRSIIFEFVGLVARSPLSTGSSSAERTEEETGESVFLALESRFDSFEGSRSVNQQLVLQRQGKVAELLSIPVLGRVIPVVPQRLFLGLERFQSRWISGLFGLAPIANLRVIFQATAMGWSFRLEGEDLARSHNCPCSDFTQARVMGEIIKSVVNVDPFEDLLDRFRSYRFSQ